MNPLNIRVAAGLLTHSSPRKEIHQEMPIKVKIPTPLRGITKGTPEVEVTGSNLRDCLADLEAQFPGMKERLFDEEGELRRFVNIYLNEEDVRFLQGLDTPVKEGDDLSIVPAVAGG